MRCGGREQSAERVAFLLPNLGGGGAERVALTLIHHFLQKGRPVDLLLMRAEGEFLPLVPPGVRLIDLRSDRIRDVIGRLSSYLTRNNPAAMQISMWPLTVAAVIARALSRSNTRIVLSDHAALSKQFAQRGWWHRRFLRWSIRLFYPHADARVVVAQESAEDLSKLSGLPISTFEVVYNPVDPPKGKMSNAEADRLWGGAGNRILNVGRLSPQKNQKLLLEAFAMLPTDLQPRLMILGDGPLRHALEQRAVELGISDRVVMPGFVLNPGAIYRSADVFVLSSDFEGYPLVMIEAMHSGLRIVSTNCLSGPSEILNRGEFGSLTPCGDSLALADAIAAALRRPNNPGRIKARAAELSANAADRYWELMTQ